MTQPLSDKVLGQIRGAGMQLPRPPYPGKEWRPGTDTEKHLLSEGYRLDRVRQLLLVEVGRLRRAYTDATARRTPAAAAVVSAPAACPLTPSQLTILAAAAAGETPEETARRLVVAYQTVKSHRQRAVHRLGARSITQAVAISATAGWITAGQITEGATP